MRVSIIWKVWEKGLCTFLHSEEQLQRSPRLTACWEWYILQLPPVVCNLSRRQPLRRVNPHDSRLESRTQAYMFTRFSARQSVYSLSIVYGSDLHCSIQARYRDSLSKLITFHLYPFERLLARECICERHPKRVQREQRKPDGRKPRHGK